MIHSKTILLSGLTICLFFGANYCFGSDPILEAHASKLLGAREYTLQVAALMPDSLFSYRPVEGEMAFGEQLVHLADNLFWLSSSYVSEKPNPITTKADTKNMSKADICNYVNHAYDFAIESIRNIDPESLTKEFDWNSTKLNKIQFLNLIQDHQTHHRAQLLVYLRLNQLTPPRYIGW